MCAKTYDENIYHTTNIYYVSITLCEYLLFPLKWQSFCKGKGHTKCDVTRLLIQVGISGI